MKKSFIILMLLGLGSIMNAQGLLDVKMYHNFENRKVEEQSVPNLLVEPGTVRIVCNVNKYGRVREVEIDSVRTTVKDKDQLLEAELAAYRTRFNEVENAPDTLKGTLTFVYRLLTQAQTDSLQIELLRDMKRTAESTYQACAKPRFVMYPTDNTWTFLELDTVYGQIWHVQFSMEDKSRLKYTIVPSAEYSLEDKYFYPGRFELYKTKNMYTFILLDTYLGMTYQVQWSTDGYEGMVAIKEPSWNDYSGQ